MDFESFAGTSFRVIDLYLERLPARKAEFRRMLAQAALVPWMKTQERRQFFHELDREIEAGRVVPVPASPIALRQIGIGVSVVKRSNGGSGVSAETPAPEEKDRI